MPGKLLLVLAIILSFASQRVQAQILPVRQWDKTYGGTGYDQLNCLITTADGGFIAGGLSDSGRNGDKTQASKGVSDFWIVKLDSSGNKRWDRSLGGPGGDYLKTIKQTSDGGYLLGGWSESGSGADKSQAALGWDDFWVVKTDTAGRKIWDRTYGGSSHDFLYGLHETPDGNYLLAGMSDSPQSADKSSNNYGTNGKDFWLLKIDTLGNRLWDKTIGSNQDDVLTAFLPCADGGFLLGGTSGPGAGGDKTHLGFGLEDYWIVKVDANGNVLWEKTFGGPGTDYLGALEQTADGGFLVGGSSDSGIGGDKSQASKGNYDFWILKLDANGTKIWEKTLGGPGVDKLTSIKQTHDQRFLLAGNSHSGAGGDKTSGNYGISDFWLVKVDTLGNKIWEKNYGSFRTDELNALQVLPKDALVVAGASDSDGNGIKTSFSKGNYDFWILKLNAPCALITANLVLKCVNRKASAELAVNGTGTTSWTLRYAINGTELSLTRTGAAYVFPISWPGGTTLTLVSLQAGGCQVTINKTYTFPNIPEPPVVTPLGACGPASGKVQASGLGSGESYVWYKEATGGSPFLTDTTGFFQPSVKAMGIYYVAGRNKLGCEGGRTQVLVKVTECPNVFIPNAITPNHDGKNDTFTPLNLPEGTWDIQIYNRWGQQVYEAKNYQNNWPEKKVNAGTYYYLLRNPQTKQQYKGWLEVTE